MKEKIAIGAIIAALVLAYATKPSREDFESEISSAFSASREKSLSQGNLVDWLKNKGADLARDGRYERGIFTSTYYVMIGDNVVSKCTGIFGNISCE